MFPSLPGINQAEERAAAAREEEASGGEASAEVSPEQRESGPEPEPARGCYSSTSPQHSQYIDWSMAKITLCFS